jgi:hypothetical protein
MKKCANYLILPEYRLILECCKGHALVEDAISMKKEELADSLYNPDYNIIVDFQEFETFLNTTTNDSILSFFNFLKVVDIKSKVAFLTKKPHQVVISEILKVLSNDALAIKIEIFSTAEAAMGFIGISMNHFDLIKHKIIDLNKKTT